MKERVFTFLPKFEMYLGEQYVGCISKEKNRCLNRSFIKSTTLKSFRPVDTA